MIFTTGPELQRAIERRCFDATEFGFARYRYVDHNGRRTPEYAANRIEITAAYYRMNPDLVAGLADKLREIPGCLMADERSRDEKRMLRPRVVAIFDRTVPL